MAMNCQDVERLLTDKVLGELTPAEQEAVASHLAECEACRGRWDPTLQSQELYDAVRPARDTSGMSDAVLARIGDDGGSGGEGDGERPTPSKRQRLGGFELLGRLGRGGMGTVLKARQISMDRIVALKILPKRLAANEDFVKRFIREARAAARLRHPNIVQAYDVGLVEGYYYFAMEYVEGETCEAILRREGALDQACALSILKQTASALAAAHEAGIVHRDIKPSNIMLDPKGEVRVTDFGLAKRTEGDIAVTADGGTLGTPAYVSPEMAAGKGADARSDLYSLGATAFHLLTGRPAFTGASYNEVLIKQVNETPPALAEAAPHVDRRLCGIVDRLLRKNPAARFASAQALLEELEALGERAPGGPSLPPKPDIREAPTLAESPGQRMRREFEAAQRRPQRAAARRRTAIVAGSSAAGLLAVVLIVWVLTRPGPKPPPPPPPGTSGVTFVNREHDAEVAFRSAQRAAGQSKWQAALGALDGLKAKYGDTKFYASNRIAIDDLRAKTEAAVKPLKPRTDVIVAPPPPPPIPPGWVSLFDGQTLGGWRVAQGGVFGADGEAKVQDGGIVLIGGERATGIAWTGAFPRMDYEVAWEAKKLKSQKTACTVLFPLERGHCLFGAGWVTGFSFMDGREAFWNPSFREIRSEQGRWHRLRLRLTASRAVVWVDGQQVIEVPRRRHTFRLPGGHGALEPFGFHVGAGHQAALRRIRYRHIEPEPGPPPPHPAAGEQLRKATVPLHARWVWADTGLHVQRGETCLLTAIGRWGQDMKSSQGPQGVPDKPAPKGWPLPGAPRCAVVGRVGARGKPFLVGAKCKLVPEDTGRLLLTNNNQEPWDNWGMVRVAVEGPLVADRSAWLVERFTRDLGRITVPAREEDVKTDIEVGKGDVLLFEAEGQWSVGAGAGDADGLDKMGDRLRLGMLHASPTGHGCGYQIGRFRVVEFLSSGKLELSIHDPDNKDSSGSVGVTVRAFEPPGPAWTDLFDGKSLDGWQVLEGGGFRDHGKVHVRAGRLRMELGPGHRPQTGIAYTGPFPRDDYEVDAMRAGGNLDFGCLVFPLGDEHCTLIVGGHIHGNLLGFREVDGLDAWDLPQGHKRFGFQRGTWYRLRLRVERDTLTVWVDDEEQFAMPRAGRRFEPVESFATATPFGVCTHATASAIRRVRVRRLDGAPIGPPAERQPEPPLPDPEAARRAAIAAYAKASEKVWGLLARRDYDEAEKLVAALAGPVVDARSRLVRGVFLLAEGDLPAARKALAAGGAPHAAIYKARLNALAGGK